MNYDIAITASLCMSAIALLMAAAAFIRVFPPTGGSDWWRSNREIQSWGAFGLVTVPTGRGTRETRRIRQAYGVALLA